MSIKMAPIQDSNRTFIERYSRGYTVLEMLLVLAILSIVIVAVYQIYNRTVHVHSESHSRLRLFQSQVEFFHQMADDLGQSLLSPEPQTLQSIASQQMRFNLKAWMCYVGYPELDQEQQSNAQVYPDTTVAEHVHRWVNFQDQEIAFWIYDQNAWHIDHSGQWAWNDKWLALGQGFNENSLKKVSYRFDPNEHCIVRQISWLKPESDIDDVSDHPETSCWGLAELRNATTDVVVWKPYQHLLDQSFCNSDQDLRLEQCHFSVLQDQDEQRLSLKIDMEVFDAVAQKRYRFVHVVPVYRYV